ncbi:MAG TPA: signal protein [Myxococcaceae bacterium]|nr:signal protein [Myxococcaceae bacterium]
MSAPRQRKMRNYLLDAPLQLRFTAVLVTATLLGAGLLGIFLARAMNRLSEQAERAVEARAAAAQASHELGNASLSKTLLDRFNDPQFTAQLERQARAIDAAYQAEQVQVAEQRRDVARESTRIGWLVLCSVVVFVLAVLLLGIVITHRIAGPVYRVRRLLADLGEGRREVPRHGLRDGDELRELFDSASSLVKTLRAEDESTFEAVSTALASPGQTDGLRRVHDRLAVRLGR